MTANQIAYWQLQETKRRNRVQERQTDASLAETKRGNLAKEMETNRSNLAREIETNRANVTNELLKAKSHEETLRSNLAKEAETNRANVAKEIEANRHNIETEKLEKRGQNVQIGNIAARSFVDLRDQNVGLLKSFLPALSQAIKTTGDMNFLNEMRNSL